MTREAFAALVRRVEKRYQGRPTALERSVARWATLGLAGLLAWVAFVSGLGLILLSAGAFVEAPVGPILVVIGAFLTIYGVMQAAYILGGETAPADGRLLADGEAPELRKLLDRLRDDLKCPPFDEIRITNDLNAGVREQPRLGLLGWRRTALDLGLPLAMVMSPDEFAAVLAHEMGHHYGRHVRATGRIHRLTRSWSMLSQRMRKPAGDSFTRSFRLAISKFVNWYWPRLHARNLVLSRVHEHQADLDAARLADGHALATALWRMELFTPWLSERFWSTIHAGVVDHPEPPENVVERLSEAIRTPPPPADAAAWVERGLVRATIHDETHPALLDRVQTLGLNADDLRRIGFPTAPEPSAAQTLLGDVAETAARELSTAWRKEVLGGWRDRHRKAAAETRRKRPTTTEPTDAASASASASTAEVAALWESACRMSEIQGLDAAVPLLRRVLEQAPDHGGATVALGRSLGLAGDPEGEVMLRRVVDGGDVDWMLGALQSLQAIYRSSGRPEALREIDARLDRHEADLEAGRRERSSIRASDDFIPHGLDDETLNPLRDRLAAVPDLDSAWLVRKKLKYIPSRPLFVLCVRGPTSRWGRSDADGDQAIVRRLTARVELPGQVLVVAPRGTFKSLGKTCIKAPGAEVFRRKDVPSA